MDSQTRVHESDHVIATFLALGLGIFVALFLSRRISATTQSVLERTEAIAGGDLARGN